MATIDETRTAILQAYHDNADYEESASSAKCAAFITACRRILSPQFHASRAASGAGEEFEFDLKLVANQLTEARQWQRSSGSGASGSVVHANFSEFRG